MTGNLNTLAEGRAAVKAHVDGGGSCNNVLIDARIAEAEERLWPKLDQRNAVRRMRIRVSNRTFPLPLEVEAILKVDIDGAPAQIFGPSFEYLASGIGDRDYYESASCMKNLLDMGEFPVMFDIPIKAVNATADETLCEAVVDPGFNLIAFSNYVDDAEKFVTVRGHDRKGDEIHTTIDSVWSPGETIQINRWHKGVEGSIQGAWSQLHTSSNLFTSVSAVSKMVTTGPVTLYAVNTTTHELFLLSKMIPEATVPSYRRYRILNQACTDDCAFILALVKVRFRKATRADDVLSIQNLSALRLMVQALGLETAGDIPGAHQIETKAYAILLDESANRNAGTGPRVVLDYDFRFSPGACNRGYNI